MKKQGFIYYEIEDVVSKPIYVDELHISRIANRVLSFMSHVPDHEFQDGLNELKKLSGQQFVAEWTLIVAM